MLNNLEIKKCLYIVLAILFATVGMVGLSALGFNLPFFRQVAGFILLTIIPGALILRILKVHNISTAESLVYSVGLSIAFDIFIGFLMNTLYPLIGITRPIALYPVTITFAVVILALSALAYLLRDKDFIPLSPPNLSPLFSPPYLFLMLLPLLAILGALLVAYYQNNTILLIFIAAVAATFALAAFGKFIPEEAYPLAITLIAIGLVYHTTATLASPFITGYDIQVERLVQRGVVTSGYWNPAAAGNLNTALSITLHWPMYSLMLDLNEIWVLKLVYPLLFAAVPLALFLAYREQIGNKRAFFAVFFFMSVLFFLIPGMGIRVVVGELFLAPLLLLAVEQRLSPLPKSALTMAFIVSLPIAYYALTYIALFLFIASWLIMMLMRNKRVAHWWQRLTAAVNGSANSAIVSVNRSQTVAIVTGSLIGLFIVFALSWYMYTASGTMFQNIVRIPVHLVSTLNEFFNPLARESLVGTAIGTDFVRVSLLGRGFRIFQYITQIFIIIGFVTVLLRRGDLRFRVEYLALSTANALVLFLSLALPYFSGNLEVEKFYHFSLLFLSPFCILGGEAIWQVLSGLFQRGFLRLRQRKWLAPFHFSRPSPNYLGFLTLIVLLPYFLFNTGFVFEIARSELYGVVDTPSSEALSSYRLDMKVTNPRQYAANEWLATVIDEKTPVYADIYAVLSLSGPLGFRVKAFPLDGKQMPENTYVYLKTWNIDKNEAVFGLQRGEHVRLEHISFDALPDLSRIMNNKNLIYDNGGARILAP